MRERLRRSPHRWRGADDCWPRYWPGGATWPAAPRNCIEVPSWWPTKAEALYREGQVHLMIDRAKDAEAAGWRSPRTTRSIPGRTTSSTTPASSCSSSTRPRTAGKTAYVILWQRVRKRHSGRLHADAPVDARAERDGARRPRRDDHPARALRGRGPHRLGSPLPPWPAPSMALGRPAEAERHFRGLPEGPAGESPGLERLPEACSTSRATWTPGPPCWPGSPGRRRARPRSGGSAACSRRRPATGPGRPRTIARRCG